MRNLGPATKRELRTLDLCSRDDLASIGWREACIRWTEAFPHRLNLNAFAAIIGAIEDVDWRRIDPSTKEEARRLVSRLRNRRLVARTLETQR